MDSNLALYACPPGFHLNAKKKCVKTRVKKVYDPCPQGEYRNSRKKCVPIRAKKVYDPCPEGEYRNSRKKCVAIRAKKVYEPCPDGRPRNKRNQCPKSKKKRTRESDSDAESESDVFPHDPVTGLLIEDFDIDDPSVAVEWRNAKGQVVNIAGDVADAYGELVSNAKKKEKSRLKFVRSPQGGVLTAGEEEFQCYKKGIDVVVKAPEPAVKPPVNVLIPKKKIKPASLFPLPT